MSPQRRRLKAKPLITLALTVMAALSFVGCSPAASSPEQAVTAFYGALASGNHALAWSLIDVEQQDQLARELDELRKESSTADSKSARLARNFGGKFAESDVSLSAQDFFVKAMESATTTDPALKELLAQPLKIVDISGENSASGADVVVRFGPATNAPKVVRCVRDGAGWRIRVQP